MNQIRCETSVFDLICGKLTFTFMLFPFRVCPDKVHFHSFLEFSERYPSSPVPHRDQVSRQCYSCSTYCCKLWVGTHGSLCMRKIQVLKFVWQLNDSTRTSVLYYIFKNSRKKVNTEHLILLVQFRLISAPFQSPLPQQKLNRTNLVVIETGNSKQSAKTSLGTYQSP